MLLCLLLIYCQIGYAQSPDTLNGYDKKIAGDEISYFSHLHQFANTALLTRMNGSMPISWQSPLYTGNQEMITYELLLGHSTGTSTGERHFDCLLNGEKLFTITTPMHQKGKYQLQGQGNKNSAYRFIHEEYDVNGDAFGRFYITLPARLVKSAARFTINGLNENSRDWLMIFMYHRGLKLITQPTNLVTRKENRRQLNVFVDNPYPDQTPFSFHTTAGDFTASLTHGYNSLQFPAYDPTFTGTSEVAFLINHRDTIKRSISLSPVKNYIFCIIHHSHNDIGYSHLQTEVEQIQNRNIRAAIAWAGKTQTGKEKPIWHIESLWAVENFLKTAAPAEEQAFVQAVKNGNIVLSANYANVLTGLCQLNELNWMTEYARQLSARYGITISNAMITDIPGISRSAMQSYVTNHIPYLSLGPNYIQNMPDHGDRVGGVINEQGDQLFYWKPFFYSNDRLLVWTAGKGYSFFHGITDSEKQAAWEKRISDYCNELTEKNYPYDLVQLRYTKNADNGPVDSQLTQFVENWNQLYSAPQLRVSSVDALFREMEKKYGSQIPIRTGEISPYWEDGAFSTAIEEMQARNLVQQTLSLETQAKRNDQLELIYPDLYALHKNLVLFHEHTWGAWCSVSDPENPFTTEQWRIKKSFLDSAIVIYKKLKAKMELNAENGHISHRIVPERVAEGTVLPVSRYTVDPVHGGLSSILVNGKNPVAANESYFFFEPVYALGLNPMKIYRPILQQSRITENTSDYLTTVVTATLPSIDSLTMTYTLSKKDGRLTCRYRFYKKKETDKESLHIAFPFAMQQPVIEYSTPYDRLRFNRDQLPGSNREFVCVENDITVAANGLKAVLSSPSLCLYEVGSIIDENKVNGAKVWKRENPFPSSLFLYVLNNYWHTNYKAYQEGWMEFEVELQFQHEK